MKKLGLFLAIVSFSISGFAQNNQDTGWRKISPEMLRLRPQSGKVKDPCPDNMILADLEKSHVSDEKFQKRFLQDKAQCWKDVVLGKNENHVSKEQRDFALRSLKKLFEENLEIRQDRAKTWVSKVMEAMVEDPNLTIQRLIFYLGKEESNLGLRPDFVYTNRGSQSLDGEEGDYLLHAVLRTVNNYEEKKFGTVVPVLKTLIQYANVCVKNLDEQVPAEVFERTEPVAINIKQALNCKSTSILVSK